MKFNFISLDEELRTGLEYLKEDYDFCESPDGIEVTVKKGDKLYVEYKDNKAEIKYGEKVQFFRALGHLIDRLGKGQESFAIEETARFDTNGPMIDMSHGAVLNVETTKSIIRKMAVMGLNMLMLYREQEYYVDGEPYFGYMRGRQPDSEIKELDDYAYELGIEIVPAIQCLGHLQRALRWETFAPIRDTFDCLLVGEEKTYEFIENMIKCAMRPLRTKKVHIGFDETMSLGTGQYMVLHGHRPRIEIFLEHLERVSDMIIKMGYEPMVWADMFFRTTGTTEGYDFDCDTIPPEVEAKIPMEMGLVSWDYTSMEREVVERNMRGVTAVDRKPYFAGATIDWMGFCIDYDTTFASTAISLTVAREQGIKDVIMTTWGDDLPERDYMLTLLGCQIYAEYMYQESPTKEEIMDRYDFCANSSAEMVLEISYIDKIYETETKGDASRELASGYVNPSKYLFWQDPLVGLFDHEAKKYDFPAHYRRCAEKLSAYKGKFADFEDTLDFYIALCNALEKKCDFGVRLREAYINGDRAGMQKIADEIPALVELIEKTWTLNRVMWTKRQAIFGFEIIERRYGALVMRLRTAIDRIEGYLEGRYAKLEELDEVRLSPVCNDDPKVCYHNAWTRIASAWVD